MWVGSGSRLVNLTLAAAMRRREGEAMRFCVDLAGDRRRMDFYEPSWMELGLERGG